MTLLVGVCCPEGSLLLTDSLTLRLTNHGIEASQTSEHKIGVLDRAQLAYVHSGQCDGRGMQDFDAPDFVSAAREAWRQIDRVRFAVPAAQARVRMLDGSEPTTADQARLNAHELIVASARSDSVPRLGFLTDDGEHWFESGVVVGGAAYAWWRTQPRPPAPTTLSMCQMLAYHIAGTFKRYCYGPDDWACDEGRSTTRRAPIIPPFNVVGILRQGVQQWEVWL